MNFSTFLRILNKTSKFCISNGQISRSRKNQINVCRMSTNVSVSRTDKERDSFMKVLPSITDSLAKSPKFAEVPEVGTWLKKVLEYNLMGGKKGRGLITVVTYEMLENPENLTEESMQLARVMGWCAEMLQAYLVVLDDMMDGSTTRRGAPCWYRLPEVGIGAVNDSILIYMSIFQTLKTHIGHKPYYTNVMELFNDSLLNTSIGQHLDYTMAHRNKNDYSLFTIDRYNAIVKYKTAYYTYKLTICLGCYLAGRTSPQLHKLVEDIALDMGEFFQIQDDFIDCFGDEALTGKKGTDIQEGKCSWLAVAALARCDDAQRERFERAYASDDPAHVLSVKRLYEELRLPDVYKEYETASYERILNRARALSSTPAGETLSPELIHRLLDMIYNRRQ